MGQHITALHTARKAFTEAECSERIRRALRKQLRPNDEKNETGDKVYYKRTDCVEWKGPGVVIGQEGVVIFVRHGGTYVRVHHSRLRKANADFSEVAGAESPQQPADNDTGGNTDAPAIDSDMDIDNVADTASDNHQDDQQPLDIRVGGSIALTTGQIISYLDKDTGVSHTAKVMGRAGKATGKNKNWFNLQYSEPVDIAGTMGSADLTQVEDLQVEPLDNGEVCSEVHENYVLVTEDVSFNLAKLDEITL